MFKGRSVVEIMILVFTIAVAWTIMATGVAVIVIHILKPHVNTERAVDAIFSFVSAILGALLGLIAGRRTQENITTSIQPSSPPSPPSDSESR